MTTEFVLIRHGQTNWNIDRRYQGISQTPLNETGMRQAAALGQDMHGEHWDVIASSPLARAWGTALPVAEAIGYPLDSILPDERLIERLYGVAEGYTLEERERLYPGDDSEGLEPLPHLRARSMGAVEDYLARFPNQRIILVTHGTWINYALDAVSNGKFGYGKTVILNASRTYVSHDEQGWHVGEIFSHSHGH